MQTSALGSSDVVVSRIVFGAMWPGVAASDLKRCVNMLHRAVDHGVTSIDTAPLYEFGLGERIVGEAIAGRRDRVQVLTKVGLSWDGDHGEILFHGTDAEGNQRAVRRDSRPEAVRRDIESSLSRLGTDFVDLAQIHQPDPLVEMSETIGELLELQREGKVRAIGVSNFSHEQVQEARRALPDGALAAHQLSYSPLQRYAEKRIIPAAITSNVGILAYSPLAQGVLTGRPLQELGAHARRKENPALAPRNRKRLLTILGVLSDIATDRAVTVAQVSLAWTLAQPGISACIVGASSHAQATQNAAAGGIELNASEMQAIDKVLRRNAIVERTFTERVVGRLAGIIKNRMVGR